MAKTKTATKKSQKEPTEVKDTAVQEPPVQEPPVQEPPVQDAIVDESVDDTPIKDVQFPQLTSSPQDGGESRNLDLILDISVPVSVELGRTSMLVKDIINLTQGSVVELEKLAGSPVELLVRGKLIAHGEVVVVEENFGVKITTICGDEEERLRNLA